MAKKKHQKTRTKIHPAIYEFLATGKWPSPRLEGQNRFGEIDGVERYLPKWELVKEALLATFIRKYPCTRPVAWWEVDAPRWNNPEHEGCYYHGKLPEPRQRISGKGELHHGWPFFKKGIPCHWDEETLKPEDPLIFESEAAYLLRHGLLTDNEKAWLDRHKEALDPEQIEV